MKVENKTGGQLGREERAPKDVRELDPSRTVMPKLLNRKRAVKAKTLETVDVPFLRSAVLGFQPEEDYDIRDVEIDPETGAAKVVDKVKVTMQYGRDDPDRIMSDFKRTALVGKLRRENAAEGASEIDRRTQLRLRLRSVQLEQLLEKAKDVDLQPIFADPQSRKQLSLQLDEEIRRIEETLNHYRRLKRVQSAGGA